MFYRVDDELRYDQSDTHGVTRSGGTFASNDFKGNCATVADHRRCEGLAQFGKVGADRDLLIPAGGLQVLLDRCNRHDASMSVLKMKTRLRRINDFGLHEQNAGNNLQRVSHPVAHLLEQHYLLLQELLQGPLRPPPLRYVLE